MKKDDKKDKKAQYEISVCVGATCSAHGSEEVNKKFQKCLRIKEEEVSPDGKFIIEPAYCMGACAMGPNVLINDEHYENMKASKVAEILKKYQNHQEEEPIFKEGSCPFCQTSLLHPSDRDTFQIQGKWKEKKELISLQFFAKGIIFPHHLQEESPSKISWTCPHCKMPIEDGTFLCSDCNSDVITLEKKDGESFWFCSKIQCGKFGVS